MTNTSDIAPRPPTSAAQRLADALLRTLGGATAALRVSAPTSGSDTPSGSELGLLATSFASVLLSPVALRRLRPTATSSNTAQWELLVSATSVQQQVNALDLASAQSLFSMTLAVTIADQDYLLDAISANQAFGQPYLYRLQLREAQRNSGQLTAHSCQRSDVRDQRSDVRDQTSEIRDQSPVLSNQPSQISASCSALHPSDKLSVANLSFALSSHPFRHAVILTLSAAQEKDLQIHDRGPAPTSAATLADRCTLFSDEQPGSPHQCKAATILRRPTVQRRQPQSPLTPSRQLATRSANRLTPQRQLPHLPQLRRLRWKPRRPPPALPISDP